MIDKEKIKIYRSYKGDVDMFARSGSKKEHNIIKDEDFFTIDDLLQNIEIVNKGLASQSFIDKLTTDLKDKVSSDCIDLLKQLVIIK